MDQKPVLSLKNVSKAFPGTKALTNVTLDFYEGEIHALVGENGAGKSTMMNIIGGIFPPTSGTVEYCGEIIEHFSPLEASRKGIGFVHQETSLCQHVSVAENVYIGNLQTKNGIVDFKKLYTDTEKQLQRFQCNISPTAKVSSLSVAEQQIVEITKALSHNCKVLILDEPTSSLTTKETVKLFEIIRQLKQEGVSIIYISHRLSEIFDLCDRVTVLRDGFVINTSLITEVDTDTLISRMVGRKLENLYPEKSAEIGEELLRVDNISGDRFDGISFHLNQGEILGFAGLVGAGRTELMRAVTGIDKKKTGDIYLKGEKLKEGDYRSCIDKGIVYMTEDRKAEGLFLSMEIRENMVASIITKINGLTVDEGKTDSVTQKYVDYLNIKAASFKQKCNDLSGGNQQKVLLGKSLSAEPTVLIIDEPTRGIDVGAKFEVYKILRNLCERGIGIIIISSDLPEVIGICDRVEVMYEGKLSGSLNREEITEENVMRLATKYSEAAK